MNQMLILAGVFAIFIPALMLPGPDFIAVLLADPEPDRQAIDQLLAQMQEQSSKFVVLVHDKAVAEILELPAHKRAELPTPE